MEPQQRSDLIRLFILTGIIIFVMCLVFEFRPGSAQCPYGLDKFGNLTVDCESFKVLRSTLREIAHVMPHVHDGVLTSGLTCWFEENPVIPPDISGMANATS